MKSPTGTARTPALRRYLGPGKLFRGRLAAVQRSGPESTGLRTRAAVSDHTFIAFHIISTHCPDSARMRYVTSVAIPVWYRGHRSEHRMFTRSSLRHEQSCSGRTLRIRTMAGTPIIQLRSRLFCSALLLCALVFVSALLAHSSVTYGNVQYLKN